MKFIRKILTLLLVLLQLLVCEAQEQSGVVSEEEDFVLIITSYNPDTQRMSKFITDFEAAVSLTGNNFRVLIENMGFKGIDECHTWRASIERVINKYHSDKLRAIILLGQEAWISFLSLENFKCDVPFYTCFTSQNGIVLPENKVDNTWEPVYVDVIERAKQIGNAGGFLNRYDVEYNINAIKTIYPTIKNIALLTDNSYGGVTLQAFVKHEMEIKFPNLNLILLDSRKNTIGEIGEKVANLPPNTAMLIGTWRIDKDGLYFSQSKVQEIIPPNVNIPVFSITGLGIGTVAIGGQIPDYTVDATKIANNINQIMKSDSVEATFFWTLNQFVVDQAKIKQYGINMYQLPENVIVRNELENKLIKSKKQNYIVGVFAAVLATLVLWLYIVSRRLRHNGKELQIAKDKAEESERLKSAFLANMSHEIRTPLNSIVGFSDMLINTNDEQKKAQFGRIITTNSDLLLNLINDILDLSKIESGYTEFVYSEVDIAALFNELYTTYTVRMKSEVELKCVNPFKTCSVLIDKQRTIQIITNFVTNAIKFTEKGSITIGYEYINEGIKIFVTDTGIGIDDKGKTKIFERFEKLNTFAQGTGLGLSICKAIITSLHGEIGVDSTPGQGSTFWAWIPCKRINIQTTALQDRIPSNSGLFNNQSLAQSTKILIVEDDESNFMLIEAILEDYEIERAINGRIAIEKAKSQEYSLILMDIRMPIMSGLEATQEIRKFDPTVPIIAITANAFELDKVNALKAGCNDFLTKPIKKDLLLKKIVTFIS